MRTEATSALQGVHRDKLSYWRKRFSLKIAFHWDENSRFFHASASGRRRKNYIQSLDDANVSHSTQAAKAVVLHNFYSDLPGQLVQNTWDFLLSDLYTSASIHSDGLTAPFTMAEITEAIFAMDVNSSPGPDGFGPSFYSAFWTQTKGTLLRLLDSFHAGVLDLDGLSRAHLVLLPKKDGANTADAFRPISLQNCPMKLITKVLSSRLRPQILSLIDPGQTGFIHGRNIFENFIYAADLLSYCHKWRVPTIEKNSGL